MTDTRSSVNKNIDQIVKEYLALERIPEHRQHIEQLVEEKRRDEIEKLLLRRLTFGTAGIRGRMGAGYGQMNDLVIIQTSQGLASYLLELDQKATRDKGVVIGHDARHNSARFARLTALAFLQKNIPVYYCDHIVPTPLVAFGVKHYSCQAGIMITASHNPKHDNGYKVYWSNGAQILSPHDKNIQEHIVKPQNQLPWPQAWQHETVRLAGGSSSPTLSCLSLSSLSSSTNLPSQQQQQSTATKSSEQLSSSSASIWSDRLLMRIHGDLSKAYFAYIEDMVGDRRQDNQSAGLCITFTAMHGVGHMYLSRALDIAGFEDIFPVESQKKPDPEFSTVKFPNPEEAGALDMAFETAKHANSTLILANDPDSDRCAAALYDPKSDYKRILNGNEIGALLGWWRWHCYRADNSSSSSSHNDSPPPSGAAEGSPPPPSKVGSPPERGTQEEETTSTQGRRRYESADCYMISTAVSSKFLQSMARVEGFQFRETLTGFKHMGNLADRLLNQEAKLVLFAYEEATGYMPNATILDKDGISAAVQLAECAAYVSSNYQRTLEQQLDWLYAIYGYHYSLNSYYLCSDANIIREIFTNLQSDYPTSFGPTTKQQFRVSRVRDLNTGHDSGEPNKRAQLPTSTGSYMLTFFLEEDNITFTIRTSGTEPKIKYYSEIVAKLPDSEEGVDAVNGAKLAAQTKLQRLVEAAIERCLRPNHYCELEAATTPTE